MLSICYSLIGVFGGIYIFRENFEYILYRHTLLHKYKQVQAGEDQYYLFTKISNEYQPKPELIVRDIPTNVRSFDW